MTEYVEHDYRELSTTVANQGAQINSIGNRLGRLEHEFMDYAKESRNSFNGIESAIAQLSAHKPTGLMEIIKGAIILGAFVSTLIGGISYVVHAIGEPRMALLEYKMEQVTKRQGKQRISLFNKSDQHGYFPDHAAE